MQLVPDKDKADEIISYKAQAKHWNSILQERLNDLLPKLMREAGLSMWLVISREYNEDPVLRSLLPAPMLNGDRYIIMPPLRQWTMFVYYFTTKGTLTSGMFHRLNINGPGVDLKGFYDIVWPKPHENEWTCLRSLIEKIEPETIGVNISNVYALSDGLNATAKDKLKMHLPKEYMSRLKSAESLSQRWLEVRSEREIMAYPRIVQVAQRIISKAFSADVVHPGITTAKDISWWIHQKINDLNLSAWFHPYVSVQRKNERAVDAEAPIRYGDILHCDVGLRYLGLCTDNQHLAYVMPPCQKAIPQGLREAIKKCNRLQDIVMGNIKVGKTGNEVLQESIAEASLAEANGENIKCQIYTHPIGCHGHGAGPAIGLWGKKSGVPGKGEAVLQDKTCYALELCVFHSVPEWGGQEVMIPLEEDIILTETGAQFLSARQEDFYIIQ